MSRRYELTSYALDALRTIVTLAAGQPLISGSRIETIMDRIRVCALQASDDPDQRIEALDDEIARLSYQLKLRDTERDRIRDGAPVISAPPQVMREEYDNVTAMLTELPRDFRRIDEAIGTFRSDIQADWESASTLSIHPAASLASISDVEMTMVILDSLTTCG